MPVNGATKPPLAVMIVDDHFVVRSGLAASLEADDSLRIAGEARNGEEVIEVYRRCRPDVVLMDLQLPGIGGVAATESLLAADPEARVLVFSTFARDEDIQAAMEAGALGYLQKSTSREELIAALRGVAEGRILLAPALTRRLAALRRRPAITRREREILVMIAGGRANKEIASALGVSEDTIKRHVSHILAKLDVNDRAQASVEAIRRGILTIQE